MFLLNNNSEYRRIFINTTLKHPWLFIKHFLKADSLLYSPVSQDYTYVYSFDFTDFNSCSYEGRTNSKIPIAENIYNKIVCMSLKFPLKYFYQPGLILFVCIALCFIISKKYYDKQAYLLCTPMFLNTISLLPINLAQDLRYCYINYLTLAVLGLIWLMHNTEHKKQRRLYKKELGKIKGIPKILLIIPAYNEEKSIVKTINSIKKYNLEHDDQYDYIVINDGSTDKTEGLLTENSINHIKLINNLGIGGAVQTGYKYAYKNNYDIAVQFDGDGQHDINYVKDIVNPIVNGQAHMVIGSRFINDGTSEFKSSKVRRIGINLISKIIMAKTGFKLYDTTSGFRACNKEIINQFVQKYPIEYPEPISSVGVIINGYILQEVPVKMNAREAGVSSISSWKNAYYMINVILSMLLMEEVK